MRNLTGSLALLCFLLRNFAMHTQTKADEEAFRNLPGSFSSAWAKHGGHDVAKHNGAQSICTNGIFSRLGGSSAISAPQAFTGTACDAPERRRVVPAARPGPRDFSGTRPKVLTRPASHGLKTSTGPTK